MSLVKQEALLALTTTNSAFLGKDFEHGVGINIFHLLYYKVPQKTLSNWAGIFKSTWTLQGPPLAGLLIF